MRPVKYNNTQFFYGKIQAYAKNNPLFVRLKRIVKIDKKNPLNILKYIEALGFLQKVIMEDKTLKSPFTQKHISTVSASSLIEDLLKNKSALGITQIYQSARSGLIKHQGQFCSYCEMAVQDSNLAVEHILPKSKFVDESVSGTNFLLACPMCNSYKLNNPTDEQSDYYWPIKWSNPQIPSNITFFDPSNWAGYVKVKNVINNTYLWPYYNTAYSAYSFNIKGHTGGPYTPNITDRISSIHGSLISGYLGLGPTLVTNIEVTLGGTQGPSSIPLNSVSTNAPNYANGANANSNVLIDAYDTTTGDGLLNLNAVDHSSSFSDRRLFNRTLTYFMAIRAFNHLQDAGGVSAAMYNIMMEEVISTASSKGFFSIWVATFNAFAQANPGPWLTGNYIGPTPAPGSTSPIPMATVDFIMQSTGHHVPIPPSTIPPSPPPNVGFPGTNINNTIP